MSQHYENFPVASLLLPPHLRNAVMTIYHFAREADDIADEGNASPDQRLQALQEYRSVLVAIQEKNPVPPHFEALKSVIETYHLPISAFYDLLKAFSQDVVVQRYANESELAFYCSRSANPIGELLLALYQISSPPLLAWSNALCTALQKVNFWQDIAIDWQKNRIYLPQSIMQRFHVDASHIAEQKNDKEWQAMMRYCLKETRIQLLSSEPLAQAMSDKVKQQHTGWRGRWWGWRLRLEVRLIRLGGLRILDKIEQNHFDIWQHRPTLKRWDWLVLIMQAVFQRPSPMTLQAS